MPPTKSKSSVEVAGSSSLVDAFEEILSAKDTRCKVARWIDGLSDTDRTYLEARLSEFPKGTVYAAVGKLAGCSSTTWNRHFADQCSCDKGAADV